MSEKMFYAASTGGFYVTEVHGDQIPVDAVEITPEFHRELMQGQQNGMRIAADETGLPVLVKRTRVDGATSVEHAKELLRSAIRMARTPLFESLDVAFMRALERGDTAEQQRITAEKQRLRDLTKAPEIEAAQTVDGLKAFWPL